MTESVHGDYKVRKQQLLDRFRESGFEQFLPDEVLELMLSYGGLRQNTDVLAHKLLVHFGSLDRVLGAYPSELMQVPGVTRNIAVLLSMMRAAIRYDIRDELRDAVLDSERKACRYFAALYRYEDRECVRLAILDGKRRVTQCAVLSEGSPSSAGLTVRQISELMFRTNCTVGILAHNHPRGTLTFSDADIAVTRHLVHFLSQTGITISDHILAAENSAVSMREKGLFAEFETDR